MAVGDKMTPWLMATVDRKMEEKHMATTRRTKINLMEEEKKIIESHKNKFTTTAEFIRCAIRQYEQNEREIEANKTIALILENQLAIEKLLRQLLELPHPIDEIEELPGPHYRQRHPEDALEKPSDPHYYQRHPGDALEDLPID